MPNINYLVSLSAFPYFGPARTKLLTEYFGSAKKAWNARPGDLTNLGISPKKVAEFLSFRSTFNIKAYFERLGSLGVSVFSTDDEEYPAILKQISDAPPVLYVRGVIKKEDRRAVAIVGTRSMTMYGKSAAEKISRELAGFGVTIVSGLALGIDAEAHKAALSSGGRTIAVLASGLDQITPHSNTAIAREILKGRGALVSENPLGHIPQKHDFAVRNRLISGLAEGIVVIEGKMKSGTFYTVNSALDQGKPVFAVPGPINLETAEGPNHLIKSGAKLVSSGKDIIEEFGWEARVKMGATKLSKNEEQVLQLLDNSERHLDELVRISGIKAAELSGRLTIMEMKGRIKNIGSGVYKKII
jgi:DNA processing protein